MAKLLISGLCLQGNKGGAALAVSLMQSLSKHDPSLRYEMLVPGGEEFALEQAWSQHYDVEVVPDVGSSVLKRLLKPGRTGKAAKDLSTVNAAIKRSDGHINMTGVAYVGPPVGNQRFASAWSRFRLFQLNKLWGRPFIGWTQSYGPFGSNLVRRMARMDLKSQKIVFCRGEDSAAAVREILPNADIRVFPDVAFALGYDADKGAELLRDLLGSDYASRKLVTMSPSAVPYAKLAERGEADRMIKWFVALIDRMEEAGLRVLLVPHTVRPNIDDPSICDRAVCRAIVSRRPATAIVEADLPVEQLKAIFSHANVHIGARYHSLVGALGAGTPAISLSWHPKYRDLMSLFGMEDQVFAFDDLSEESVGHVYDAAMQILAEEDARSSKIAGRLAPLLELVHENAGLALQALGLRR